MADKETGLNIPVSAVADKDSAKEAVNELTKGILSSLKDGYIEIPAELKVPIKGASKDLEKAQKDVINQWEKTFKEGFSSSAKDLDNLTNAYQRFKKLAGQQHKANTKQSRGISAIMGGPIQEYSMSRRDEQARRTEFKKQIERAQKQNSKKSASSKEDKLLAKELTNEIKQENKRRGYDKLGKELRRGTSRARGSTPGADINLGLRRPRLDGLYVDGRSLRMSEISPYRSVDEARRAKEQREIRRRERASLTTRRATSEDIEDVDKKLKQREAGGRSQSGTEYELIKRALLTEVAKIQGGLIKGKPGATSQKLIDQVLANLTYDEEQGVDPLKSIMGIHNMLQKRYDTKGKIGTTDGTIRGEGKNQEEANETLKQIYKILGQFIDARQSVAENVRNINDTLTSTRSSNTESLYSRELNRITNSDQMQAMKESLRPLESEMTNVGRSIKIGNTKEAVEFDQSEKISKENKDVNRDTAKVTKVQANAGFNIDSKADALIELVSSILQVLQKGISINDESKPSKEKELTEEQEETQDKTLNNKSQKTKDYSIEMKKAWKSLENSIDPIRAQMSLIPISGTFKNYYEGTDIVKQQRKAREQEEKRRKQEEDERAKVQKSTIYASPLRQGVRAKLEGAFDDLIGATKRYEKILKANAEEQDAMAAERIKTYGLNNGRNPNDTGDIAGMRRILQLYRTNKESIEQNPELAQKIQLTPGRTVDTTELTRALNDALSGKNMRNAQMGGSIPRQIIGGMTAFIGMPSLEKSRAQADGLNQILGNINKALQSVLINIQTKETELSGMQASGQAKFTKEGYLTSDSTSAAFKTLADLEEEKLVLDSIQADLLANDEIVERTGGKFSKLVKNLSFTSPVLKENNGILRNINSGLDKNGKALKFQTRMAEILNYTFQLMSRSIGQMFKNWLSMLNPLNIIKRLFEDYASYDPKWQRTMNVIKNNFREIILPFMQKIAQFLVNIIGFLDIISMKIQEAFGYTPISLFDQQNANDFKKTYEEISNITAGFDELHDIGSSGGENDPDNLLGEIYKPQLSQEWIDLANQIGDLFAGLIKGDLGFGDVMKKILEIAWNGLQRLWSWFKNTEVGQWLIDNWKKILGTILAIYLAWKGLKILGPMLFKALFGSFTSGAIGSVFSKIGSALVKFFKMPNLSDIGLWGAMTSAEKLAVVLKGLIGISTAVAGAILGISTAYDSTHNEKELSDTEKAMNGVKSVAGTVLTGLGALIATGNPAIAAVAMLTEKIVEAGVEFFTTRNAIGSAEEELQEWKTACEEADNAQTSYREGLQQLREKEELYGMSAKQVYDLVESGKVKYEDLTAAQMDLYNGYAKVSELQQTSVQASQKATEEGLDREIQKVQENKQNWQDCYQQIEDAYQRGDISFAQYVDSCEELNSVLDGDNQKVFQENIPSYLKEAWNPSHYESSFQNLENAWGNVCTYFEDHPLQALFDIVLTPIAKTIIGALVGWAVGGPLGAIIGGIGGAIWGVTSAINKSNSYVNDVSTYTVGAEVDEDYWKKGGRYYDIGTNYVPSDGLAYLHQGEAVIPKKYNQPYQPNTMNQAYVDQIITTVRALDNTIKQGINVKGEFKQRGSDLVATVKKVENRNGNQPLNNAVFAR